MQPMRGSTCIQKGLVFLFWVLGEWGRTVLSPVYSHGQLYVAISWVTSSANIKIFSGQGPDEYMRNVVYREVLEM